MTLTIELTPDEEERLTQAARREGLDAAALARKLLMSSLNGTADAHDLDARLRRWQEQDGTALLPVVPTDVLFAQWAEEDARMTPQELQAEDRLWQDLEKRLLDPGARLQLRRPA
jgi:hypothetical protein